MLLVVSIFVFRQTVSDIVRGTFLKLFYLMCDYSVSQKKSPLLFSDNFFQTNGNFLINSYTPIIRSFLH